LSGAALAGPVTSTWGVAGPDDTAGVAAAALSGWYASADSYEDAIELRDVSQTLVQTITRQEIVSLLPWMDLNGSQDGVGAVAFSDSGRLLFISVHDAAAAGDGLGSDAVLRYDTETGDLAVFARLEILSSDGVWADNAMVFHAGRLYVGLTGAIRVYRAQMNDRTGVLLSTYATGSATVVTGLAVDRGNSLIYAAWNGQVYRSPVASLSFTAVGALANVRGLAYSDHYGAAANAGLYALSNVPTTASAQVQYISPSQARGLLPWGPSLYLFQPTVMHDIAATADGRLLIGADEDALAVSDSADTRLSFDAWKLDEFNQVVTYARGLIAPDPGDLSGLVIDADVAQGGTRFHPATPDAACWTVLLLLMSDELTGDAAAQGQVRTILQRYAGLSPDGFVVDRNADGIYRHWIEPSTGGVSAWDPEFATMSTMKIVLAASRAATYYPQDAVIQAAAREIICGVRNWDSYIQAGTDRMYLKALPGGGPDLGSGSGAFHEGMIFVSQAAAFGGPASQLAYSHWLDRSRWPRPALVTGADVSSTNWGGFLPAFVSLYELLTIPEFRASPAWQSHIRNLRLSNAAWTDDNAPKFNTVFSAGTTKAEWGGYHADSLTGHPGDVATFTSLLAFSAGNGAGTGRTQEAVAAYNAYRRGARQTFASGARMLYRRSNVDQGYAPDSAGMPDVGLGALGLAELIQPGSVAGVLGVPYVAGSFCDPARACGTSDFNGDGDFGTDADIEAFFGCLGGNCCGQCFTGGADFNGDGDTGTDADIESFFRVLGGGNC
jgi:hypothetical protein